MRTPGETALSLPQTTIVGENGLKVAPLNHRTVLAITRRSAQFCGTQALLDASGLVLLAAKNMTEARSVLKAGAVKGVIVCMHSWSSQERESIAAELAASHPDVAVIVRCPVAPEETRPTVALELCTIHCRLQS